MLDVQLLTMKFGGLTAVQDVSLQVGANTIVGLIGPNGAGKTTLFNCITGIYEPTDGHIEFSRNGHSYNITKAKPYEIIKIGMARTFQNVRLFPNITVLENVLIGYHSKLHSNILQTIFKTKNFLLEESRAVNKAYQLLSYFEIEHLANTRVKELPFGRQKVLEVVRALISSPQLLLLDEPAAGLNTKETHELMEIIRRVQEEFNLSVFLIEHDMKFVMSLCQYIYVMDHGELIASGEPHSIQNNPIVISAYLGETVNE